MCNEHADRSRHDEMSVARCRQLLGDDAAGLSDADVERVRDHADTMAHVIVALFLEKGARAE